MTSLQAATYGVQVLAAVSAVLLARRRAEHVPAAVALVLLAAVGVTHAPIAAALRPLPRPVEGPAVVLVYVDGAVALASYAIVVGLAVALAVSPERRRFAVACVAGVWLLASIALGALYPSPLVRGAGLQRVYLTVDLVSMFAAIVALVIWARAGIRAKRSPGSAHAVAIVLVVADLAVLVMPISPWRGAVDVLPFEPVQLLVLLFFAAITAVQVTLWRSTSVSS